MIATTGPSSSSSTRRIKHIFTILIACSFVVILTCITIQHNFLNHVSTSISSTVTSSTTTSTTEKTLFDNNNKYTDKKYFTKKNKNHDTHDNSYTIPKDYNATFTNPGWTCSSSSSSSSSKHKKLIFIHVFKTAGSTFRTFFANYGKECQKGVSIIIGCSQLSSSSFYSKNVNETWKPNCTLKRTMTYTTATATATGDQSNPNVDDPPTPTLEYQDLTTKNRKVTRYHLQKYADIVIGHLPIGIHPLWTIDEEDKVSSSSSSTTPMNEQYIAFFREPFVKYVSGRLFVNQHKQWTMSQAITEISNLIKYNHYHDIYYNGYIKYLTTPYQKEEDKIHSLSHEQWVEYIKRNIIDMHVVVGIVEYMSDSVSLMQSLIDVDRERTESFRQLIMKPEVVPHGDAKAKEDVESKTKKSLVKNQSTLSSSKIVSLLQEDKEVWSMLEEMLKYEVEIYNFALDVHKLQIKELKRQFGDRYKLDD